MPGAPGVHGATADTEVLGNLDGSHGVTGHTGSVGKVLTDDKRCGHNTYMTTTPKVRCYVCGQRVPKERTQVLRHRVSSGAVRTPSWFTYRMVRKCVPYCGAEMEGAGDRP